MCGSTISTVEEKNQVLKIAPDVCNPSSIMQSSPRKPWSSAKFMTTLPTGMEKTKSSQSKISSSSSIKLGTGGTDYTTSLQGKTVKSPRKSSSTESVGN